MGSGCSCCETKPEYNNGSPLVSGKVTPCFEDGRLFKVESGKSWYFYNDTLDYAMVVTAVFGEGSEIEECGRTEIKRTGSNGACTATLTVLPLETQKMVKLKEVNGFKVSFNGKPFSQEERRQFRDAANRKASEETTAMLKLQSSNRKIINEHLLLKAARKKSLMFVDTSFPPTEASLFRQGLDSNPSGCLKDRSTVSWRRPQDYLPEEWHGKIELFSKPRPTDIDQGQLGDCYFLCACAALAEYKPQIEGIFKNHHWCYVRSQEVKYGGFRVNLNIGGWWRTIIVDSYLPTVHLLPVFARNRHHPNQLWVSMVEKAYAKAYGSYQAIVAGFPWQALEDLTGFPSYDFSKLWKEASTNKKSREKLFKQLEQWNDKNYLISISTPNEGKITMAGKSVSSADMETLFDKAGLATGHAYTVLDVKQFPMHGFCLLKIRNPWGSKTEWTGDWGDNSPKWKEYGIVKFACKPEKKADGVFWMEWKDVVNFFDTGAVCFRKGSWFSKWYDYRISGSFNNSVPNIALEVIVHNTSSFSAFIGLHQKDRRGLRATDPDSKYAPIMLSLSEGELEGDRQSVIANSDVSAESPSTEYLFQQSRSVSLRYEFKKNKKYLIIPRRMSSTSGGNNTPMKKFVLSMVASEEMDGKHVEVNIVRLSDRNDVFRNMSAFNIGALTTITTLYQRKEGNDVYKTYQGTCLHKGSKVESAKYKEMV